VLGELVQNFETVKLGVGSPDAVNVAILCLLGASALVSLKKSPSLGAAFLTPVQTDQIRGVAILLVIVGHFWFHVSQQKALLILSGDAIAFFFLLSGFGLTMSVSAKPLSMRKFIVRRMQRVLIPYWCTTILFLVLDAVLLGRTYPLPTILLTLCGINMNEAATHLDYVRWYITVQLLWYILFSVTMIQLRGKRALALLSAFATLIFFADYYITRQGWSQLFAFPAGCACGIYYKHLSTFYEQHKRRVRAAAGIAMLWVFFSKATLYPLASATLPQIVCKVISEANGLLCAFGMCSLLIYLNRAGFVSRFLLWCGRYSYELFLLHGPLLIKYNPVIRTTDTVPLVGQLAVFLCLLLAGAWLFHRLILLMRCIVAADTQTYRGT